MNRAKTGAKNTTADADIPHLRWLLIDIDSKRPAGISASESEHAAGLEMTASIRAFLRETYEIEAVYADSGNGGHLYLPLNFPNEPENVALLKLVLAGLAFHFDTEAANVDATTYNPSRICKMPGTIAVKGDATSDRPHRRARLLDVPSDLTPCPLDILQSIANLKPLEMSGKKQASRPTIHHGNRFDLRQWVAQYGINTGAETAYQGGVKWQIDCPFDPTHKRPDAALYLSSDGFPRFSCSHNSCSGRDWKQYRAHYEPEYVPGAAVTKGTKRTERNGTNSLPDSADEAEEKVTYRETERGLVWNKPTKDGSIQMPLTNFTARIVADIAADDGAEVQREYRIEARRGERHIQFNVPIATFDTLNWPAEHLGVGAYVYPGLSAKDHTRVAIRELSGDVEETRLYTHTGWRQFGGGRWGYLHAGGVIGIEAPVVVRLSGSLQRYLLPEPPTGDALHSAVRACLRLLALAPAKITFPLLSATFRAALGTADFSLALAGPSGAFKTQIAALAQQHFGSEMRGNCLPASWSSTDNALEDMAFRVKDALLVIDDFAPTPGDAMRLHTKADRILRAQGNNSGRQRMRADLTLRPERPPRGLILSTGEDVPQGKSLKARQFVTEVEHGDVDAEKLTACQKDAAAGLYAQVMAAFLAWLAPNYGAERAKFGSMTEKWRTAASTNVSHRRTPETVAELCLGLHYFLVFACSCEAITLAESNKISQQGWEALQETAKAQNIYQQDSDPALRFLELLRAALSSGRAHVADQQGLTPDEMREAWGWRSRVISAGENERLEWQPQGERIGFVVGENLYLIPDAAYSIATKVGNGGEGIAITPNTLWKRLKEANFLRREAGRESNKTRKMLCGTQQNVLHLSAASLVSEKPDKSDIPDI